MGLEVDVFFQLDVQLSTFLQEAFDLFKAALRLELVLRVEDFSESIQPGEAFRLLSYELLGQLDACGILIELCVVLIFLD